ncbi:MAG: hypothetical protein WCJ31_22110, partial [Planctomycetia bacterium]
MKPPPAAAKLSPEVRRHAVPKPVDPRGTFLLVDISNSFVKLALAGNGRIGRVHRLATKTLEAAQIAAVIGGQPLAGTVA